MNNVETVKSESVASQLSEDPRELYEAPELSDLGDVAQLTKSGTTNPGSDSGYS